MSLNMDYKPYGGIGETIAATTASAGRKRRGVRRPVYSLAGTVALALLALAVAYFGGRMT